MALRKCIAILEDDSRRRVEMFRLLDDRLYMYSIIWFRNAPEMIDWFKSVSEPPILISLDHDLEDERFPAGTGRDVADFLVASSLDAKFPIILHSSNTPARIGMAEALKQSNWICLETPPYEDLAWIADTWFPAVKQALRRLGGSENRQAVVQENAPHENGVISPQASVKYSY